MTKRSTGEPEKKRTQARDMAPDSDEAVSVVGNAHQKIAERAYRLYLDRGAEDGHALEDWLRAERDTLGEDS